MKAKQRQLYYELNWIILGKSRCNLENFWAIKCALLRNTYHYVITNEK